MFSNEVHAITLSLECMKEICSALSHDHQKMNLKFISTGDSAIASYLFNPKYYIKDTLIRGHIYKCKTMLLNLSIQYSKSFIQLNSIEGANNLSDFNCKLFLNPVDKINTEFYRHGHESFKEKAKNVCLIVAKVTFAIHHLALPLLGYWTFQKYLISVVLE